MAAQRIGLVRSGAGRSYDVKWDPASRQVFVSYAGWSLCGQASSSSDAMRRAEAYLYDK
ncbi:MAG: hypothetical protein H6739_10450 [Alphaproteobacteria bacterium]|nr:hypothetical protein [Alphaproteobacteria bacterium]